MHRASVLVASAVLLAAGCSASFKDRRTPSGDFCSDMPVVPADEDTNLEYHRLVPVQSDMKARTEAERIESLRRAACLVGGDAVIEAVNEEVRNESAQYVLISSGTAVIWVRPKSGAAVPLVTHKKNAPPAETPAPQPTAVAPVPTPSATVAPPPATDRNGVRRPGAALDGLRHRLSSFYFGDSVTPVTPAELAAAHAGHTDHEAIEGGHDDGHGALPGGRHEALTDGDAARADGTTTGASAAPSR